MTNTLILEESIYPLDKGLKNNTRVSGDPTLPKSNSHHTSLSVCVCVWGGGLLDFSSLIQAVMVK